MRAREAKIRTMTDRPEPAPAPAPAPQASCAAAGAQRLRHYENFPVASLLCPPRLRAPIAAIYAFARTADDIADEGPAPAAERLADLAAYRAELRAVAQGQAPAPRWAAVFLPLSRALRSHGLPLALLEALLCAFVQDVEKTRDRAGYADRAELLAYCRLSANPVGRLLLHLYGLRDAQALAQSDAICSALQLANFWQDLSLDMARGRHYLPRADCAAHGLDPLDPAALQAPHARPQAARLLAACNAWARASMLAGAPLARRLPGRAGWELRLVVQGGLRILDKLDALGPACLHTRARLHAHDWLLMAARAVVM